MMKILIDDGKLNLLLEAKKRFIGKRVAWDSILSAVSFLISVVFASYNDIWIIPAKLFKIIFLIAGLFFTIKVFIDIYKSKKNNYSYEDLLQDINKLNEITHNYSIIAIRDSFNKYPNKYLVYYDNRWECKLFLNYKDNINNADFIKDHLSRELKIEKSNMKIDYVSQLISEKISGSDGQKKVYSHKLFMVTINEFPEVMKSDSFIIDGRTYFWNSIIDLENDSSAMEKNSDIIKFVKDNA